MKTLNATAYLMGVASVKQVRNYAEKFVDQSNNLQVQITTSQKIENVSRAYDAIG